MTRRKAASLQPALPAYCSEKGLRRASESGDGDGQAQIHDGTQRRERQTGIEEAAPQGQAPEQRQADAIQQAQLRPFDEIADGDDESGGEGDPQRQVRR